MLLLILTAAGSSGLLWHAQQAPVEPAVPAPSVMPAPAMPMPPPPAPFRPKLAQPKGNMAGWVKNSDYPKELKNGESGTTGFRLFINRKGKPVKCLVTMSSGNALLDAITCDILMKRANFYPARDGYGKPQEATYSSRMRWVVPLPISPTLAP
jgi:protein TonB